MTSMCIVHRCVCLIPDSHVTSVVQSYKVNSRGFEIFSKRWLPKKSPLKAVVCFCHGYGDTCTFFFEGMLWLTRLKTVHYNLVQNKVISYDVYL